MICDYMRKAARNRADLTLIELANHVEKLERLSEFYELERLIDGEYEELDDPRTLYVEGVGAVLHG